MGTSLSGLTPATTFDGLLKVGDNDPLTADLKAISTGDGTDTILSLSNTALSIGGDVSIVGNANSVGTSVLLVQNSNNLELLNLYDNGNVSLGGDGNTTTKANIKLDAYSGLFNVTTAKFANWNGTTFAVFNGLSKENARFVFGNDELLASTRMHIKGLGADADTASLLVQNSAGAELFKMRDDGAGFFSTYLQGTRIYTTAVGDLFPSLSFAGSSGTGIFQPSAGSNVIGFSVSGSEKARIDANGLGIGETTPTARLHIKGSGNDNTTTSLLVQNSDASGGIIKIKDDKTIWLGNTELVGLSYYNDVISGFNGGLNVRYNNGAKFGVTSSSSTMVMTATAKVGIGEDAPTARLHIKSEAPSGAPLNNPTVLLVENSAGTDLFKLQDDGDLNIKSNSGIFATTSNVNLFSYSSGGGGVLDVNPSNSNSVKLRVRGANDVYLIETNPANDAVGIGLTSANAKLHIKGSAPVEDPPGTFTNPTALLVQNSAGADLLKVENAGTIGMTGFTIESNIIKPRVNGFIGISRNDNRTFSIGDSNASRTYLNIQSSSTSNFADVSVNTDHLVVKKEGNVAVGTSTLDASAKLQVDSTTQGFLPPRMTFDQRNAITAPAVGLIVYQTDGDEGVYVNTSTGWKQMQLIG